MTDDLKPRAEYVGSDEMATFNAYLGSLKNHLDQNRAKARAAEAESKAAAQYAVRDTVYMRVHRLADPLIGRCVYRGYAVAGLPSPLMAIDFQERTLDDLLHETRFKLAEELFRAKVEPTWDAAKRRAAVSVVECVEVVDGP